MPSQYGRGYPGLRRSPGTFRTLIFITPNPVGRSGVPNVKPKPTVPKFGNLPYVLGQLAAELTNQVLRRYLQGNGERDWDGAGWTWQANVNYPKAGFTERLSPHYEATGNIGDAKIQFTPFPTPHQPDVTAVFPTDIVTWWDSATNPTLDSLGWHAKDPHGTWTHPGGVQAAAPGENVTVIDLPMPSEKLGQEAREERADDGRAQDPYRDTDAQGEPSPYPGEELGRPDVGPDWPQFNPEQLPILQPRPLPINPPAWLPQPLPDVHPIPQPDIQPLPGELPLIDPLPVVRPQPRWLSEPMADPWQRYLERANERMRAAERARPRVSEQSRVQVRVERNLQRKRQPGQRRRTAGRKLVADYGVVGRILGGLTEASDAVHALWDALPKWAQTRVPFHNKGYRAGGLGSTKPSTIQQVKDVYNFLQGNWVRGYERTASGDWIESSWKPTEADYEAWQHEAINNLVKNEAQDQAIGRANKALARAFGRRTGRMFSPSLGPAM